VRDKIDEKPLSEGGTGCYAQKCEKMPQSLRPIVCRYLTALQMAQFVLIYIHAALPLFFQCDYPTVVTKVRVIFIELYIYEMVKYG
jgi:hypothetical protein